MEILHFNFFMTMLNNDQIGICKNIKELNHCNEKEKQDVDAVINFNILFTDKTRQGLHGKTTEFWINYIDMMHLYRNFSQSQRIGDFDLILACIPKLTSYFFAFNHHNYARWMVRYHHNLVKIPSTHPDAFDEFKNGLFFIHHTEKSFSGSPNNHTLEQTRNADAANQKKGITAITNLIGACQRWAESHSLRTVLLIQIFNSLGINKKEDVSRDLKPYKIKSHNDSLNKILSMIYETLNPFDVNVDKSHLFNITTGKFAKEETTPFLLSIYQTGSKMRQNFTEECRKEPTCFEEQINRCKLYTFQTECGRKKVSNKDGKVVAACTIRDIFDNVLRLSLENSIDMAEVL